MTAYEIYVLILCLLVFVLLVAAFTFLLIKLFQANQSLIKVGAKDEDIKKEYLAKYKNKSSKSGKVLNVINIITLVLLWIVIALSIGTSLYVTFTKDNVVGDIPMIKTVASGSMSKKHPTNYYLIENNLNDQFLTTDLIVLEKMPKEEDLDIYDIVLYEINGDLVLHRIVNIEDKEFTPTKETYFYTQGDNVQYQDTLPVKYSQMKGIYKGKRIPFLGSFIKFMQSPAGYICLILVAGVTIILPIIEKKIDKEKEKRLKAMELIDDNGNMVLDEIDNKTEEETQSI